MKWEKSQVWYSEVVYLYFFLRQEPTDFSLVTVYGQTYEQLPPLSLHFWVAS